MKDPDLASGMWSVASSMVLAVSVDIELRILTSLQAILSKNNSNGITLNILYHLVKGKECSNVNYPFFDS